MLTTRVHPPHREEHPPLLSSVRGRVHIHCHTIYHTYFAILECRVGEEIRFSLERERILEVLRQPVELLSFRSTLERRRFSSASWFWILDPSCCPLGKKKEKIN
ncbi:hypothetical protein Trydic_g522 [Trypoxylus dichotomus]